jgi:hypothetical protein
LAGFLGVDIDVLSKTVQSLRSAEQVLNDAMEAMRKDGHGDIGTKTLNDAAESFQRRWQFGIERIGESTKVTADGVAQCRDAYQQVDDEFAKVIEQAKSAVDGQTTAGNA